jgi:hypothetical protein
LARADFLRAQSFIAANADQVHGFRFMGSGS